MFLPPNCPLFSHKPSRQFLKNCQNFRWDCTSAGRQTQQPDSQRVFSVLCPTWEYLNVNFLGFPPPPLLLLLLVVVVVAAANLKWSAYTS